VAEPVSGQPTGGLADFARTARESLASQGVTREIIPLYFSVKEAVFPFNKFPGIDTILGPEMKSTGEVMGVGKTFEEAFVKSQMAANVKLPDSGKVFISVKESDKNKVVDIARDLHSAGFSILATRGTASTIAAAGIPVLAVNKVTEGRPHVVDMIKNNEISLIINTVDEKRQAINDSRSIRTSGLAARVTMYTTVWGAEAAAVGIKNRGELEVYSIQALHEQLS
jgi:carbamoyl-phosphate synthase large subunit